MCVSNHLPRWILDFQDCSRREKNSIAVSLQLIYTAGVILGRETLWNKYGISHIMSSTTYKLIKKFDVCVKKEKSMQIIQLQS